MLYESEIKILHILQAAQFVAACITLHMSFTLWCWKLLIRKGLLWLARTGQYEMYSQKTNTEF